MQSIVNSRSNLYNNNNATCDQLRKFAFNSHPSCYVDSGFCSDILVSTLCQNLVCLGSEVFIWKDFFNRLALDQVSQYKECNTMLFIIGYKNYCFMSFLYSYISGQGTIMCSENTWYFWACSSICYIWLFKYEQTSMHLFKTVHVFCTFQIVVQRVLTLLWFWIHLVASGAPILRQWNLLL